MSDDGGPKKEREEGWRNDDSFYEEQDPELADGHQGKDCLPDPVEEEAEEAASYIRG